MAAGRSPRTPMREEVTRLPGWPSQSRFIPELSLTTGTRHDSLGLCRCRPSAMRFARITAPVNVTAILTKLRERSIPYRPSRLLSCGSMLFAEPLHPHRKPAPDAMSAPSFLKSLLLLKRNTEPHSAQLRLIHPTCDGSLQLKYGVPIPAVARWH